MGLELVTGYSGKPHVTSYQQAMVHAGITGMDNAVFGYAGQALKAVVTSANNVRIYDGAGMIGGKIFCVNKGEYVDVPIANGASGKYRADLICVKYTKDTSTGVEEVEFQVVKGTAGTSYVDPAVVKNDLYSQGTIASQEKFYRVKLNGLAVEAVEPLFEKVVTNAELNSKLTMTNKTLWTGTILLCEGKKRTLRMDGAPIASKITLSTSDRPIVDMTGAILTTTGGASILRVYTTGAIEFSNLNGNVNNGSAFGSISWYVA